MVLRAQFSVARGRVCGHGPPPGRLCLTRPSHGAATGWFHPPANPAKWASSRLVSPGFTEPFFAVFWLRATTDDELAREAPVG